MTTPVYTPGPKLAASMRPAERFTIEERAVRYQRRYTGPWRTVDRQIGPVIFTHRYRRRLRIEWAELNVAGHDLWTHAVLRGIVLPFLRRLPR
jgi:hypothetical protein